MTKKWSWVRLTGWTFESQRIQTGVSSLSDEGMSRRTAAGEQAEAGGDEGSAHEDGAEDSPEEDAGLLEGLDLEEAEEQQEDEEVVDGERLFDGVAGEILHGELAANGIEDEESEGEGGGDPEYG